MFMSVSRRPLKNVLVVVEEAVYTRSVSMISLVVILLSIVQVIAQDDNRGKQPRQPLLHTCAKGIWTIASIDGDSDTWHGDTLLEFQLPAAETVAVKYEAILACEGIIINGTGHQILRVRKDHKKTVQFRLHPPIPRDHEDSVRYNKDLNHTCTYELRDVSKLSSAHKTTVLTHCSFKLRTYLNRILPTCNYEQNKKVLEEVEVSKEQGQVQIYLKHSANDIVTIDHNCHQHNLLGHNRTSTMETSLFPLRPPGTPNSAMMVTFYPPCESLNETMTEYYRHQRMEDCHLEIFSLCQEGLVTISEMKIDFDDDAMLCHYPKPSYVKTLESLELKFRVESKPIVALMCLLIANGALYLSITPFAITKCTKYTVKKLRTLEKKAAKSKERKNKSDIRTTASSEFDEVQLTLFDKLSSEDLRQPPHVNDSPIQETIVTQVEVEVDVEAEVVKDQPRKVEVLLEREGSNSTRNRCKSTNHGHKKREHTTVRHHKVKDKILKENKTDPPSTPPPPTLPPRPPTPPPPPPLPSTHTPNKPQPEPEK